jgi:hypothetical protein
MNMPDFNNLQQRLERLKSLSALSGYRNHPGANRAVELAISSANPEWNKRLEKFLIGQTNLELSNIHPFLPGPDPDEVSTGEIVLGYLQDGSPVMLPLDLLSQNAYIVGTTGTGKTWDLIFICKQIISQGIRAWIFDRENKIYKFFPEELRNNKAIVLSYRDLKRNPLEPVPGEDRRETVNRITSTWRGALYLRDGSANLLSHKLKELYEKTGDTANYPSIYTLHKHLSKMSFRNFNSRQAQYWETLINRTTLLADQMADTYDCSQGFDIRDLLNCSIIFNLQGLSDFLHQFSVTDLLSYITAYKERNLSEKLTNVFVIDEASLLLSQDAERSDLSEPFICQAARTVRKLGLGLILANQTAFDAPSSIIGNMNTRIVMRIINGRDIQTLGTAMSLTREQMDYLTQMPLRAAAVHSLAYPEPFLIYIPELDFNHTIDEQEFEAFSRQARSMFTSVGEIDDPAEANGSREQTAIEASQISTVNDMTPPLSVEALNYLEAIGQNPFTPVTELDRRLNISLRKGHEFRDRLELEGYIRIHRINTGTRRGNIAIVELTDKAYQYLKASNIEVSNPRGIGGFRHRFWQHQIQRWYLGRYKGCKAIIEDTNFGKRVDIGVYFAESRTAIEILIEGEQKELANIENDLDNYSRVICCCEDEKTLKGLKTRVERELGTEVLKRVWFKLLGDFFVVDASPSPSASGSAQVETETENLAGFPKPE